MESAAEPHPMTQPNTPSGYSLGWIVSPLAYASVTCLELISGEDNEFRH
jgi:hypothetical protein